MTILPDCDHAVVAQYMDDAKGFKFVKTFENHIIHRDLVKYWTFLPEPDLFDAIENKDAASIKHGRWIETNDDNKKRCSECDVTHLIAQYPHGNANYCPNCGAKMDGGADDET